MLDFLFKDLYDSLKESRRRLALEVACFAVAAFVLLWLMSGQTIQARLLGLGALAVCALWYTGLARRGRWRRTTLGLAFTLTALWGLAAMRLWTAPGRNAAEVFRMAEKLQQRGFYVAAREKLRRQCGSDSARVDCPCTLGVYDEHLGDVQSARANFQACVARSIEADDVVWQTAGLVDLGDLEEKADRNDLADQHFRSALDLAGKSSSHYGVYRATGGLARLAAKTGRNDEARAYALDALAIAECDGQRGAAAHVQAFLGDLDSERAAFSSALRYYNAAALAFDSVGDRHGRATVDLRVAHMHRRQAAIDLARTEYKQALGVFQLWEDARGQAEVLLGLGDVERLAYRYGLAREYFGQALHLFEGLEDLVGQANVLIESAHMEKRVGDLQTARERYERARTLCQRAESTLSEANALVGLAGLERQQLFLDNKAKTLDKKSKAVQVRHIMDYLEQARRQYQANGSALGEASVDMTEAFLMTQIGRHEDGAPAWERARKVYTRLGMGTAVRHMYEDLTRQLTEQGIPLPPDYVVPPAPSQSTPRS